MNSTKKSNKIGIQYGIILGAVLAILTAYMYAIDNSLYFNYFVLIGIFLLIIILGIISILSTKKSQNGFINFKDAFRSYVITTFLGLFISTLVNILIFNVIDTNFQEIVKKVQIEGLEKQKEKTLNNLYNKNVPESSIYDVEENFEKARVKMEEENQYTIPAQLLGFLKMFVFFLIFGLISAAIIKKKNPELV